MKISQEAEFLIFFSNSSMTSSNMVAKIKIHNRATITDINYLQKPENRTKEMKEIWTNSCNFLLITMKTCRKQVFLKCWTSGSLFSRILIPFSKFPKILSLKSKAYAKAKVRSISVVLQGFVVLVAWKRNLYISKIYDNLQNIMTKIVDHYVHSILLKKSCRKVGLLYSMRSFFIEI